MATATSTVAATPKFYFDEKFKLSKKETVSRSSSSCTTTTTTPLMKSNSSSSSHSHRRRCFCGFTRKCASLVKEQRARFYIMRRCVAMLICWRDYADS